MSNSFRNGSALNGFTRKNVLNLGIRNNLTFNSNGDTGLWTIREDEETDELQFLRNDTLSMSLSITGSLTVDTGIFNTIAISTIPNDLGITGDLTIDGGLIVNGTSDLTGNVDIIGNLGITGTSDLTGDLTLIGLSDFTGDLTLIGDSDFTGNLGITGRIQIEEPINGGGGPLELLRLAWNDSNSQDQSAGDGTKISFHTSNVNNDFGTEEGANISALKVSGAEADTRTELVFSVNDGSTVNEIMKLKDTGNVDIANECIVNSVSSIGALGCILVSSASTSTLSSANFDFDLDLNEGSESQSIDEFAFYLMYMRGSFEGDGGSPNIQYRFKDSNGEIFEANGYHNQMNGFGGSAVINNRDNLGNLIHSNGGTGSIRRFFATYHIATGTPGAPQDTYIVGQHSINSNLGDIRQSNNNISGLTSLASIATKILSIGFRADNVDLASDRNLTVRIFRML